MRISQCSVKYNALAAPCLPRFYCSFAGIVVGIAIMLRNPMFVGEALTAPDSLFAQIVHIIEEGGWTVFVICR